MMFGEMEYTNIFHAFRRYNFDDYQYQLTYENFTLFTFIAFLIMISLIVMNLLVGLAVSDVEKLQNNSVYAMFGMQIDLALDVELSLPIWLHSRISAYTLDDYSHKNPETGLFSTSWVRKIQHFFQGSLFGPEIMRDAKEIVRKRQRQHVQHNSAKTNASKEKYNKLHEDMRDLKEQMNEMQTLLKCIADKK